MLALQTMVTRRVDVFDPAVVTDRPDLRRDDEQHHPGGRRSSRGRSGPSRRRRATQVKGWVREVGDGRRRAHGVTIDLEIVPGYPVTVNDPAVTAWFRDLAAELVGEEAIEDLAHPVMGAEDFSYVLERVPGADGVPGRPARRSEDPPTAPQNHSNLVVFDESTLALGVALYAAAALTPATIKERRGS